MFKPGFRIVASALVAATMLVPAAAQAQYGGYGYAPGGYDQRYDRGGYDDRGSYDRAGYDRRGYGYDGYDRDGRGYVSARGYDAPPPPPPPAYGRRGYRNADYGPQGYRGGRGYRCDRGTGGTIIGAIAGGLLGNGIAGRGDRGTGTIIGAGVGALAGRAIDRNC